MNVSEVASGSFRYAAARSRCATASDASRDAAVFASMRWARATTTPLKTPISVVDDREGSTPLRASSKTSLDTSPREQASHKSTKRSIKVLILEANVNKQNLRAHQ